MHVLLHPTALFIFYIETQQPCSHQPKQEKKRGKLEIKLIAQLDREINTACPVEL
jgi:hypothetical protein